MFENEDEITREDLIEMIGDFMSGSMNIEQVYRSHLCDTLVSRVYDEFGTEGLADLMLKIDGRANWITDILFDEADLQDEMFAKFGYFDDDIAFKARSTMKMEELNKKIWRLRKRYTNLIVEEIVQSDNPELFPAEPET